MIWLCYVVLCLAHIVKMAQCVSLLLIMASLMVCLCIRHGLSVGEEYSCIVGTNTIPLKDDTHTVHIYGHSKGVLAFLQE